MIWNEAKECMSRDEIEALQSARLVKVVNRVYHNVEYYRKKMQAVGLEPGDIKGIEDLDKLPYTTYADLRDTYPFGLAAVPRSEMVRVHASSGTTGKPKIAVYTRRDIDIWAECVARCLSMAGITRAVTASSQADSVPTTALNTWALWFSPCPQAIHRNSST